MLPRITVQAKGQSQQAVPWSRVKLPSVVLSALLKTSSKHSPASLLTICEQPMLSMCLSISGMPGIPPAVDSEVHALAGESGPEGGCEERWTWPQTPVRQSKFLVCYSACSACCQLKAKVLIKVTSMQKSIGESQKAGGLLQITICIRISRVDL